MKPLDISPSFHYWTKEIAGSNKLLSFWTRCITPFEFAGVHIVMTLLGLTNLGFYWFHSNLLVVDTKVATVYFLIHAIIPASSTSSLLRVFFRRNQLESSLHKALAILDSISDDSESCSFPTVFFFAAATHVVFITGLAVATILHYQYLYARSIPLQIIWGLYYLYSSCTVSHFCIYVSISGHCLRKMRELKLKSENIQNAKVSQFIGYYDQLIEYCKEVNKSFGAHHFLNLLFSLSGLTLQIYFAIGDHYIILVNSFFSALGFVYYINGALICWIPLFLITSCVVNELQAEKFNEFMSSLVIRDKSGSLVSNPYVTAHFAIGKKLKFSACGCFYIDYRLGYSMLAACITYLVILVEFDNRNGSPALDTFTTASPTPSN